MVRTIGVHFASSRLYLAVVEAGSVLDIAPQLIEVPEHLETTTSVVRFREAVVRRISEARAEQGALLLPGSYSGGAKAQISRIGAETVIRLVAGESGMDMILLHRRTARSRLGLTQSGDLKDVMATAVGPAVGQHWSERRYAALAAFARERMP